jgi:hypothetical protein
MSSLTGENLRSTVSVYLRQAGGTNGLVGGEGKGEPLVKGHSAVVVLVDFLIGQSNSYLFSAQQDG